jgi:hypothetical protein
MPTSPASSPTVVLSGYVPEKQLAAELNCSVRTLRRWTERRTGPPVTKIGGRLWYSRAGIDTWLRWRSGEKTLPRLRRRRRS